MTATMFIMLVGMFACMGVALTEAVKRMFDNEGQEYSANLIALVNAVILGGLGTPIAYVLLAIPFTLTNIVFIPIMVGVVWLGSMLGYDKVLQLVTQVMALKNGDKEKEESEK